MCKLPGLILDNAEGSRQAAGRLTITIASTRHATNRLWTSTPTEQHHKVKHSHSNLVILSVCMYNAQLPAKC